MRIPTVCLLGLALVLCGPSVAGAKQSKHHRSACQKLSKRYKDIATSRKLVTVLRGNNETGRISACVLPRGKIRTLLSWDDGLGRDGGSVVDTAGTWVLFEEDHGDQYGGISRSLTRVEVRHDTRLDLSGYSCQLDFGTPSNCPDGTNYGEVGIAPSGAGAVELTDYATGLTKLEGFTAGGTLTTLASGAVDGLLVTSMNISWTQAGIGHTAPLPQ